MSAEVENTMTNKSLCRDLLMSTLQNSAGAIKQNKLRKLICKSDSSITWTIFSEALDHLISNRLVSRGENDEVEISQEGKGRANNDKESVASVRNDINSNNGSIILYSRNIKVPKSVAQRLQKKNTKKIKNIEKNTNTHLTLTPNGDGKSYTVLVLPQKVDDNQTPNEDSNSDRNKKRVNFAASLLIKMVKLLQSGDKPHEDRDSSSKTKRKRRKTSSSDEVSKDQSNSNKEKKKRKRDKYY